MNKFEYFDIAEQLNLEKVWQGKRITLELTTDQFIALLKGYEPDWEMRYGIFYNHHDHYFYAYRSGHIVGKYKFEKKDNNIFTCTEAFNNPEKDDFMKIFSIVGNACYCNQVPTDHTKLSEMRHQTEDMN